jgi:hypothetical protein
MTIRRPIRPTARPAGHWVRLVVALGLVGLLVACGGTSKTAAGGHTPRPSSSAAPTSTIDATGDLQIANAISLQSQDFPAQWSGAPHSGDPINSDSNRSFAACLGIPFYDAYRTANVDSQDFSLGNAKVFVNVGVYANATVVSTDVTALGGPKFKPCFLSALTADNQGSGVTGSDLTLVAGAAPGRPTQRAVLSFRDTARTAAGAPVTAYAQSLYLSKGRVEVEVDFSNLDAPVPADIIELAGDRVSARLATSA